MRIIPGRATRKTTRPAGQGGAHRRKVNEKMAKDKYYGKTLRKNFARHEEVMPMPNLLEIQKKSYQEFLDTGLREVFNDVGAITDYQGNLELTFIDYKMDEAPKYDVEECKARDATYAAPLSYLTVMWRASTEVTTPSPSARTAISESMQILCSMPVPTMGAWGRSRGTA